MFEGIYFANPNYLWLLLILPVVLTWQIFSRNKKQSLFAKDFSRYTNGR